MNQDDKIDPTGPEELDKDGNPYPECEGCGERHPPMPEGLAEAISSSFNGFMQRKQQEQERNQGMFFNLAALAMPELAKTVAVSPGRATETAAAMRVAILTLLDMEASKEGEEPEPSNIQSINLGDFPSGPVQ